MSNTLIDFESKNTEKSSKNQPSEKSDPFLHDNEKIIDLLKNKYNLSEVTEDDGFFINLPSHEGIICLSDFLEDCKNLNINIHYQRNRERNKAKVDKIYQNLLVSREEIEGGFFRYPTSTWCLYFVTVKGLDARLVDGAHRCQACQQGLRDLHTQVKVYDFETEEERWEFFLRINESSDLADIYRNTDEARQQFVKDFISKFRSLFGDEWMRVPDYKRRELITSSVPYITAVDSARFLELTTLIWPDNCSFIDEDKKTEKLTKYIKEINSNLKRNLPNKLKIWSQIDGEVINNRCRAIVSTTNERCRNRLDSDYAKRQVKEGIFLCGIHKNYKRDNIVVNHDMIKKEASESGCYIGLIQTEEEWEDAYEAIIEL